MTWRVKLKNLGNTHWLHLPNELVAELGWKEGDPVEITVEDGRIVVRKVS